MRKILFSLCLLILMSISVAPLLAQGDSSGVTCQDDVQVIAQTLGVETTAVEDALSRDSGIQTTAQDQGIDVSVVADALLTNVRNCENEITDAYGPEQACSLLEDHTLDFAIDPYLWSEIAAEELGMDLFDLEASEQSIAVIAETQGKAVDDLINVIVNAQHAAIYEAVASGALSEAQATSSISDLETVVTQYVQQSPLDRESDNLLEAARNAIGVDSAAFYNALIGGQSLAEIADGAGVSKDILVNALTETVQASIEQKQIFGEISDCVAGLRINHLSSRIESYVSQAHPDDRLLEDMIDLDDESLFAEDGDFANSCFYNDGQSFDEFAYESFDDVFGEDDLFGEFADGAFFDEPSEDDLYGDFADGAFYDMYGEELPLDEMGDSAPCFELDRYGDYPMPYGS